MIVVSVQISLKDERHTTELPQSNMVVDPRPNIEDFHGWMFECFVDGTTLTLIKTRVDSRCHRILQIGGDMRTTMWFRAYNPEQEVIPDFYSSKYIYWGLLHESAPMGTTIVDVEETTESIREGAFSNCKSLQKCYMQDNVKIIGNNAFAGCISLKKIFLSKSLKRIADRAFERCTSMDAFFLPSTIEEIESMAFCYCSSMRILQLPLGLINIQHKDGIVFGCDRYLTDPEHQYKRDDMDLLIINNEQMNEWLAHRLDGHVLHQICQNPAVSADIINDYFRVHGAATDVERRDNHGMIPLHILAINPHVTSGCLLAYCDNRVDLAFIRDERGFHAIDYLRSSDNIECIVALIQTLCIHWKNASTRCDMSSDKNLKRERAEIRRISVS